MIHILVDFDGKSTSCTVHDGGGDAEQGFLKG